MASRVSSRVAEREAALELHERECEAKEEEERAAQTKERKSEAKEEEERAAQTKQRKKTKPRAWGKALLAAAAAAGGLPSPDVLESLCSDQGYGDAKEAARYIRDYWNTSWGPRPEAKRGRPKGSVFDGSRRARASQQRGNTGLSSAGVGVDNHAECATEALGNEDEQGWAAFYAAAAS